MNIWLIFFLVCWDDFGEWVWLYSWRFLYWSVIYETVAEHSELHSTGPFFFLSHFGKVCALVSCCEVNIWCFCGFLHMNERLCCHFDGFFFFCQAEHLWLLMWFMVNELLKCWLFCYSTITTRNNNYRACLKKWRKKE